MNCSNLCPQQLKVTDRVPPSSQCFSLQYFQTVSSLCCKEFLYHLTSTLTPTGQKELCCHGKSLLFRAASVLHPELCRTLCWRRTACSVQSRCRNSIPRDPAVILYITVVLSELFCYTETMLPIFCVYSRLIFTSSHLITALHGMLLVSKSKNHVVKPGLDFVISKWLQVHELTLRWNCKRKRTWLNTKISVRSQYSHQVTQRQENNKQTDPGRRVMWESRSVSLKIYCSCSMDPHKSKL